MKYFSPERRVLAYFAKWELNKHKPEWLENPNVQRVLVDGELDIQKVKELLMERNIATETEFDQAITTLEQRGYFNGAQIETVGIQKHLDIEGVRVSDLNTIEATVKTAPEDQRETIKQDEITTINSKEY